MAQYVSAPPPPARNPPPRPSDPHSSDRRTNFRADGVLSPHRERIPSQPRVDQTPANNRTRGAGHRAGGAYCAACAPPQPPLVLSGTRGGSVIATALGLKTAVRPAEFLGGQGPLLGLSSSAIGSYRGHSPSSSRPRRRRRGEQCASHAPAPLPPLPLPPHNRCSGAIDTARDTPRRCTCGAPLAAHDAAPRKGVCAPPPLCGHAARRVPLFRVSPARPAAARSTRPRKGHLVWESSRV